MTSAPSDAAILAAERQLLMLAELAELGMDLARDVHRRAMAAPESADPAAGQANAETLQKRDPAETFGRVTRAIRLTFALETRTHRDLLALRAGVAAEAETRAVAAFEARRKALQASEDERVERLQAVVGEAIEAEADSLAEAREMDEALRERLDCDAAYEGAADMPLREAVEQLCADLGLTPDWARWTGDGWGAPKVGGRPRYSPFRKPSRAPFRFERMTQEDRDRHWRLDVLDPTAPPPPSPSP